MLTARLSWAAKISIGTVHSILQVISGHWGEMVPFFLQLIHTLMGAERILHSIDYPFQSLDGARDFIGRLPVSDAGKALIAHGNVERLLGL